MYFPYLRGRQFELIALRELNTMDLLSDKIIPIIEPVKASSTLIKTLENYNENKKAISIVHNPQVGAFKEDLLKEKNSSLKEKYCENIKNENIIIAHQINASSTQEILKLEANEISRKDILAICCNTDYIAIHSSVFSSENPKYNLIPDESVFRHQIRNMRIVMSDRYNKQRRNADYAENPDEVFSHDHLYYSEDGYKGFSDFSIVGDEYVESGFAPHAVAIHIVYFDSNNVLRIHHFVSESNDDIFDPAGKFGEALIKLVEWNKEHQLATYGIQEFERLFTESKYPGLGVIKKLSIMHHLELMSEYLNNASEG